MRAYPLRRCALLLALTASCVFRVTLADDGNNNAAAGDDYYGDDQANNGNYYNDDAAAAGDDVAADQGDDFYAANGGDDDGMNYENQYGWEDNQNNYDGDDFILYWTDYAILPKRCIT